MPNKYKTEKDEASGLLRIIALIDIPKQGVKVGDKGGLIEKEFNLSQADECWVSGNAWVYGNAQVRGDAWVAGDAWVYGNARVFGNAQVYGNARVFGAAWVSGNARVFEASHIISIGPVGSRNSTLTMFRTDKGSSVVTGCFLGTLAEFEAAVKKKPEGDVHRLVYEDLAPFLRSRAKTYIATDA